MNNVFEVYEIEWPSRHITGPSQGVFGNFEAAHRYVRDTFTPVYDRHTVIVEVRVLHEWPPTVVDSKIGNTLTYYHQVDGEVVLEPNPGLTRAEIAAWFETPSGIDVI